MSAIKRLRGEIEPEIEPEPQEDIAEELRKAIDEHIQGTITGRNKKSEGFSPSNTNDCGRYLVYTFRGVFQPASHDARVQRIFDNGHAVHERIYGYLGAMGILREKEIPVRRSFVDELGREVPFKAFADGIVEFRGQHIIELKSIGEAGFAYRKTLKKPKDDHYKQTQLYLLLFDFQTGFVIYENKNTQEILVLKVERNQPYLDKLLKKYGKVYKAYQDGQLPVRPYKSAKSEQCKMCNVRDKCWNEDKDIVGDIKI